MANYLTTEESDNTLEKFNKFDNKKGTILDLFEKQVQIAPDNIAVSFNAINLSYVELNYFANQFADYLIRNYKVQSDDLIAIKLEKSEWVIISILAILKSGGAYVPIDTSYPIDRINYIINDCNCKLVIDENELIKFKKNQNQYSKENSLKFFTPDNLAYIIYTSGSTGKPKGVMIEHRNLISRIITEIGILKFIPNTFFTTNYVFDVSLLEIFLPIVTGGTIIIPSQNTINITLDLIELLKLEKVNVLQGTPSFFNNLVSQMNDDTGKHLSDKIKLLCVGGESLNDNLVQKLKEKLPKTKINNHYGPTETTIDAIVYENVTELKTNIIGKPIENTQVYIMDSTQSLVSKGEIGEIFIGGEGVARGYLNNPELSNEKFICNPFSNKEKIYKTGDLGRWLPNGEIEFIGRIDDQVKIRGYRIELGEIETVLLNKKLIDSVVVKVLNDDVTGENNLVAYIISKEQLNFSEIREYLKQSLPIYMIPSYFIQLKSFPLTANGKVDKQALPTPNEINIRTNKYVEPRNETEKILVRIWEEILGQKNIGINDNFFELGGHSLKAMHLLSKINNELGLKIDLSHIFNFPCISNFSENLKVISTISDLILEPALKQDYYECTINQRRLWYIYKLNPLSTTQNESMTIDFHLKIKLDILLDSLTELINRHETFRTNFITLNNEPKQLIHEKISPNITVYDLEDSLDKFERVETIIAQKESHPFNLETDNLFFVSIFKLDNENWKLNFVLHHILTDGWSNEILKEELNVIYTSLLANQPYKLPPIVIQNKDYAEYQKKKLTKIKLETNQKYWHSILGGEYPVIELPKDNPYKIERKNSGSIYQFFVNNNIYNKIKELSNNENASVFTILLSGLNILISKICKTNDFIVSSAFSERENEEVLRIIGYFISPLMLRTKINEMDTYKSFLKSTRYTITDAVKHHDYPIEKLIEELDIKFDYSKYFMTPVSLNMINYTENKTELFDTTNKHLGDLSKEVEYELDLEAIEYPNCIELNCFYKNELFNKKTIENMMRVYVEILEQVSTNTDVLIKDIESK